MKHLPLIVGFLLLLAVNGCEKHDQGTLAQPSQTTPATAAPARTTTSAAPRGAQQNSGNVSFAPVSSKPRETALMQRMGLQIENGRIILDTEKSKKFFESLGRSIKENIHHSVKKAEENMPSGEDLGIQVKDKKVVIDLNKTRNFMKEWVETMEILGRELNRSLAPIQP